jgi:NAD(P)-dependent dehydrogenase (short-subunit alcohol dehydrogenase family)
MTSSGTSSSSNIQKVAVVTGSSSGIGYQTSLALARSGFLTYATMRNLQKRDTVESVAQEQKEGEGGAKGLPLRVVQLDVTDETSVKNAIRSIVSDAGRIDVLVNNAGYGLHGAFEDLSIDEIKKLYETNVFGVVRVTHAVLPTMRKQHSGRIINISSGAGRFGFPGGSAYVSSKFALEGLSESMAYELDQFGIKVVLVEPGFIRTNFTQGLVIAKKAQDPNSPYAQMMKSIASSFDKFKENASPPELVAKIVVEAATAKNPNLRYLAGKDVEQWVSAKKNMSDEEFYASMNPRMKSEG